MYICWCLTSNNSQYIQISNHWDLNLLWIILQLSTLASDKDTVCIGFTWQGHLWPSAGQPRDSSWPVLWLFPLNDHQWSQVEGVWPRKHDGNKSKTSVSHPLHSPQYTVYVKNDWLNQSASHFYWKPLTMFMLSIASCNEIYQMACQQMRTSNATFIVSLIST